MEFDELVRKATGHAPYSYQRRLAHEGHPDVLAVPTGAGKTLAAVLPWLYRRRFHPDENVRCVTPRWLVFVLPMRVLVEQSHDVIGSWLKALGLSSDVRVHRVMGGEPRRDDDWRLNPHADAVFVGTVDMLVSRALNRGYGASRWSWPIDFGLFNNGCQWVFDEVQLLGPALGASLQLEGLRRKVGVAQPCRTMWMSATVDRSSLSTYDLPHVNDIVEIDDVDRTGPLAQRLGASKLLQRVDGGGPLDARALATKVLAEHVPGTRTIVVLNTVDRATDLYLALAKAGTDVDRVLVHSRFRPPDRRLVIERALADIEPDGPGRIVVTTQVLEAGVDVSSRTLITEAAPWPSIVQRAGRCNRNGADPEARMLWLQPPKAAPYEQDDVDNASRALAGLDGEFVAPESLSDLAVEVGKPIYMVPRRRDLFELFDTLPDLSGNDIDVSRFIRDAQELDVEVAWVEMPDGQPGSDQKPPVAAERCSVPVGVVRDAKRGLGERQAWRYDHIAEGWIRVDARDVRPGMLLLVDRDGGGYTNELGWHPQARDPVAAAATHEEGELLAVDDDATGADPLTFAPRQWQALEPHLAEVEREVRYLASSFGPLDLTPQMMEAAAIAGRLHDIGKAHECFQEMLERTAADATELNEAHAVGRPWAKSGGRKRSRHSRRHFRHELASALALLGEGRVVLEGVSDADLAIYLVAAHHGRVRLGFRSLPDETEPPNGGLVALGVWDGDLLPAVLTPAGVVPESTLRLDVMALGGNGDEPSWASRAAALRDREDLGPFRLAFLESLVRLADWRASAGLAQRAKNGDGASDA